MRIIYRDELGYVSEVIDEYGISFDGTTLLFNDRKVDAKNVVSIGEENDN